MRDSPRSTARPREVQPASSARRRLGELREGRRPTAQNESRGPKSRGLSTYPGIAERAIVAPSRGTTLTTPVKARVEDRQEVLSILWRFLSLYTDQPEMASKLSKVVQ